MSASAIRAERSALSQRRPAPHDHGRALVLQCPRCRTILNSIRYGAPCMFEQAVQCPDCSFTLCPEQGIWKALPAERLRYYERFLMEYQIVRAAEGRGSQDAAYYLALPSKDLTRQNQHQWAIRARTYGYIERKILPDLENRNPQSLDVLDLGAGNGWLSYRLALRHHRPVAVDLSVNGRDGLGASVHFLQELPSLFPRFQAELDALPFGDAQFDCAIFGASFHYSEDYARTLAEAIRCLRPGGTVIIADSPWYRTEECGQRMLQERRKLFTQRYGFPSDGLASLEYLTSERLAAMEARLGISWRIHKPNYGLRWAMRPLMAKWQRKREPSQFRVYTAKVKIQ